MIFLSLATMFVSPSFHVSDFILKDLQWQQGMKKLKKTEIILAEGS